MRVDPREFDRLVLESIDPIVAQITSDQLNLPTPCTGWDLGELMRHMIGQHRGFAAAARLEPADPQVWEEVTLGPDPYATYRESAQEVTQSFARPDLSDHSIEIHGYGVIPAPITMQMHAVDYLAHGWDVAKTIGADPTLDAALCEHGLKIALRWPENAFSKGDPFAAHVSVPDDAPVDQRLMAYLGRDPNWTAR
ncbi:MAG TPA: TIGR03086 family protein [Micromonosporaceae bacterium]|nr:TIGR03086 family protein [Micromonosporaceae bacterium]HCU50391.1 TIGR03086 family protein [Micromonosporaceae bacterium]